MSDRFEEMVWSNAYVIMGILTALSLAITVGLYSTGYTLHPELPGVLVWIGVFCALSAISVGGKTPGKGMLLGIFGICSILTVMGLYGGWLFALAIVLYMVLAVECFKDIREIKTRPEETGDEPKSLI